jgi:Osteopetrosis-associated transmembrane protein 1 precursor
MELSNPFLVCTNEKTFDAYRLGQRYYQLLFTTHDVHDKNLLCSDKYLNKNQMHLISTFLSTSQTLWESANCDDCYEDATSSVHNFSRNTVEFLESQKIYNDCVQNVTIGTFNMTRVCSECDKKYSTLNKLYEQIKKSKSNKICFDLEDKVSFRFDPRQISIKASNLSLRPFPR